MVTSHTGKSVEQKTIPISFFGNGHFQKRNLKRVLFLGEYSLVGGDNYFYLEPAGHDSESTRRILVGDMRLVS